MADGVVSFDCERKHHKQLPLSFKRPKYREARWERAVKVYTINLESKYVLVQGVPAVGASKELLERFALYGAIQEYRFLDEYQTEPFTEVYWIKFQTINSARVAKKKLDNHSFFGGILHVCYAPEYETVDDTREKLQERRKIIAKKTRDLYGTQKNEQVSSTKPREISTSRQLSQEQVTDLVAPSTNDKRLDVSESQTSNNSDKMNPMTAGGYTTAPCNPAIPTLPLPPLHLPPYKFPPPPPPWEFPRVPSAHATLPAYLQNPPLPPLAPPSPSELPPKGYIERQRKAVPRTIYMSEVMIGPQPQERTADNTSTLTGNESLDWTVLSIRKTMQMVSNSHTGNSHELSRTPTQNTETSERPVHSTTSTVPNKKRKRI